MASDLRRRSRRRFPFLGDAVDATDLRALFKPGTIK
jgi:hypothetical protein